MTRTKLNRTRLNSWKTKHLAFHLKLARLTVSTRCPITYITHSSTKQEHVHVKRTNKSYKKNNRRMKSTLKRDGNSWRVKIAWNIHELANYRLQNDGTSSDRWKKDQNDPRGNVSLWIVRGVCSTISTEIKYRPIAGPLRDKYTGTATNWHNKT